jgi:hypothetical protein
MVDLSPGAISRKARTKGGIVTIVTVASLVAAIGLTWLGLSVNDHVSANYDAESWLYSISKGELARVNGITGKVDTRQAVPNAKGHPVQLSQADRYLILRDISTGKVSAFDPATLAITSNLDTQQGLGITIALHNDAAFIVDAAQGVVRQLDPATLQPIGDALRFPPGITGGFFDGRGRLWIAVPSEGTVTAITPAPVAAAKGGQGGAGGPARVRTEPVAQPWHDLAVSALDDGVAVLDQTNGKLWTLRGDSIQEITTDASGGSLPDRATGGDIAVTIVEGRQVFVISGDGKKAKISEFRVPGEGKLQPAVAWAGRIYVADDTSGKVYVLDRDGKLINTIAFTVPGPLQLEVRENHLFINSPGSSQAHVINDKNEDKTVDKFVNEILGGDPPIVPPPPNPVPPIDKPGAPKNIKAAAGDNQVTLTWGKAPENGSRIIKYIVSGAGQTLEVGANQREVTITGLVNGTEYQFGVKAVNGIGTGPEGKSNKVVPTRDVPDPPTDIKAVAQPNGTVEVTWTAANGQGRQITQYLVTASSSGAKSQAGATGGETKLVIPDKELDYGKQYAFSVVTVNDIGANSKPSAPLSNTVVPFNKPSAVKNLRGATLQTAPGAVRATWGAADENGRPITEYQLTGKSPTKTVTAKATGTTADLTGFADGETVTIDVIPLNLAGSGPKATTSAKAVANPTLSGVSNNAPGYNSILVKWAYNDGGGSASCEVVVSGSAIGVPCSAGAGGYNVGGLWPGNGYNYYVKISNAAGAAQSGTTGFGTPALNGTVTCNNTSQYGDPTYCNDGIGVYTGTRQQTGEGVGDAFNGQQYQVFCKRNGTKGNQSGSATLSAVAYNNSKQSSMWIQIEFRGNRRYIPWIWINLDAGDNYNMLPDC